MSALDSELRRLRKRVKLLMAERYGLFGAAAGAAIAAVLVLLSYHYDELLDYALWAGAILLGALAGVAWGLLRRLDDLTVASAADKRAGLKERFSTAVSLGEGPKEEMEAAVVADAGSRIAGIRSGQVFRHRFGLPHALCGAAMLAFLIVLIVPQLAMFQSNTRRQEVAVMKHEGRKLLRIAKDMRNQDAKHEELRKLAVKLQQLGAKMETGRMSRKQAMLKAQKLAKDIAKEQDRLAKENSAKKTLAQAQAEMRQEAQNLAKSMAEKLAKKENIPPEEALKKLPSDKQLAELARKEGPLSQSERDQLDQALSKYADPSNGLAIPSELGEALAKLAQNKDYQRAMQIMQKLARKLNSGKMSAANREMLEKQLEQLAKALKNTDLDKLAKMMAQNAEKLAKMSPEELKKLAQQMAQMQKMGKLLAKAGAG